MRGSIPDPPQAIGDGEICALHRQRLQRGSDDKQGKDDQGRPELGEALGELDEESANGEEKRRKDDRSRKHRSPQSAASTYSAASM
jgi:hypothetical protein